MEPVFIIVVSSIVIFVLLSGVMGGKPWLWLFWWAFGYKKVRLYDGSNDFNEDFTTFAKFKGEGVVFAPRYIGTGVGTVRLEPDNTAYYCGEYKWKFN